MISILQGTADLAYILGFAAVGAVVAFLWAPLLIKALYRFKVVKAPKTELANLGTHAYKASTPVMMDSDEREDMLELARTALDAVDVHEVVDGAQSCGYEHNANRHVRE